MLPLMLRLFTNTSNTENIMKNYKANFPLMKPKVQPKPVVQPKRIPKINTESNKSNDNDEIPTEKLIREILKNSFICKGLVGALVTGNESRSLNSSIIQEVVVETFKKYG